MKIEEAIKSKFKSEKQKAIVNLFFTANWLNDRHAGVMKKEGLTPPQYNILRILRGAQPKAVSVKYIRERMLDKRSDVSRIVEKLLQKRLVKRSECLEDRRNVDIVITEDGLQKLEALEKPIDNLNEHLTRFSDTDLVFFNELLDRIRASAADK